MKRFRKIATGSSGLPVKQRVRRSAPRSLLCLFAASLWMSGIRAGEVTIAVASNFAAPAAALASAFESRTGHEVRISSGSTGQLYAQIVNGAPFDILLAADRERPRLLAEAGLGDASSVFTYAIGRLVLWSREAERVDATTLGRLGEIGFRWIAIPDPELAPYGVAARQALMNVGVWDAIRNRIVAGQNVAQAFAHAETGNAEFGIVALSQVLAYRGGGSYAIVRDGLHDPIRQDAILLRSAAGNAVAREFAEFLKAPVATSIIEQSGYLVVPDADTASRASRTPGGSTLSE